MGKGGGFWICWRTFIRVSLDGFNLHFFVKRLPVPLYEDEQGLQHAESPRHPNSCHA